VCWLATHWTPWYAYTHVNLLSCDSQNIWVGMWQCAVQCIWVNRDCLIAKQNEPRLSMVKYPLTSNYCSTCNKQSICIFVYNWLTYLQSIVVTLAKDCQKPILASVTHRLISVTFFHLLLPTLKVPVIVYTGVRGLNDSPLWMIDRHLLLRHTRCGLCVSDR